MLLVRDEQMQAFQTASFSDWLMRHLHRHFPQQCEALGPAQLHQLVSSSLQRARGHGFREGADLCRFMDLVFAFGPEFDRDDNLPWANELLSTPDISDPTEKMDLLVAAARNHLAEQAEHAERSHDQEVH